MPIITSTDRRPAMIELDADDKKLISEMDASTFLTATFPEGIELAQWDIDEQEEQER